MYVQFDLRTPEYLEHERKAHSFNILRLIAITLTMAFAMTTGADFVMALKVSRELRATIAQKEFEVAIVEEKQQKMLAEIANLRRQEESYRNSLHIVQNDPATLETLSALESNMGSGMSLYTVRFVSTGSTSGNNRERYSNYSVTVEGSAFSETQITSLMEGLRTSGVFSSVVMPSSQRDSNGSVHFSLVLNLLPIWQIGQI